MTAGHRPADSVHAPFFDHIATDLGLAAGQVLFLDDQPANVAAGDVAGGTADG